ncbi:hypothetical protein [Streptomyces phaeochromogenes]|uniref:hypothetical protein n=1 Tax=Streptomyces phaeochromogenes TaxID=1923 RepID=UPI003722502B
MVKAAEQAVESACHLADLAGATGLSTAVAEDVLDAIDILTEALGKAGPELAHALAAVAAATTSARRLLGTDASDQVPGGDAAAVSARAPAPRPRQRRSLGPGFQGIRTDR